MDFEEEAQVAFMLPGSCPAPERPDDLRSGVPPAILHHCGKGLLDTIAHDDHGFADQGILRAEVINKQPRLAADLGGQRAQGKVGHAMLQHVLDGEVEEDFAAGQGGLLHVTSVT